MCLRRRFLHRRLLPGGKYYLSGAMAFLSGSRLIGVFIFLIGSAEVVDGRTDLGRYEDLT